MATNNQASREMNGETVLDANGIERTAALAEGAKTEPRGEEDATPLVNVTELGKHMRRKRQADHLSLRAVARATQVSASTLSRIENGSGIPDAETLARLARWLNFPLERIVGSARTPGGEPVVYYPHESTPDIVEAHLRADRNLTPETARALAELFRVAYQQFSPHGAKEDGEGGR